MSCAPKKQYDIIAPFLVLQSSLKRKPKMTNVRSIGANAVALAICVFMISSLRPAAAEVVRLTEKDANGQSSFTDGSRWSRPGVPSDAYDYLVEGSTSALTIRTPDVAGAETQFNGNSLRIGVVDGGSGKLLSKGDGSVVKYQNQGLFLANGSCALGANKMTTTVAGAVTVVAPSSAPFLFTSEYSDWSKLIVSASVKSEEGTKLQLSATDESVKDFDVDMTGDLSAFNGEISVAHDEVTLALSSQTLAGTVAIDAAGAALTTCASGDRPMIGTLRFNRAGAVLLVRMSADQSENGVVHVSKAFSAQTGVIVKFDGSDGSVRFGRSRFPLVVLESTVADPLDPAAFVDGGESSDSVRLSFAVEQGPDGSRILYAYPSVNVTTAIDGGTLTIAQAVAPDATLDVALNGTEDLFAGAVLHVDASKANTVEHHYDEGRGAEVVTKWGAYEPYETTRANNPKTRALPTYRSVTINGNDRMVVDFGKWFSAFTGSPDATCTASAIPLDTVTAAEFYSVVADTSENESSRCVVGFGYKAAFSDSAVDKYPFRRDGAKILTSVKTTSTMSLVNGSIFVDGVSSTAAYEPALNEFHVYGFVPTQAVSVNAIACGVYDGFGGEKIGELAAFRTVNSSVRQEAIRRVLQRKWLGTGAYVRVPVGSVAVSGCGTLSLSPESVCSVAPRSITIGASDSKGLGRVRVNGVCELPANGCVNIEAEGSGRIAGGKYEILSAETLLDAENISSWTVNVSGSKRRISLMVEGHKVFAKVDLPGVVLVVR